MYLSYETGEILDDYLAFLRPHFRYYNLRWTRLEDGRIAIITQG